MKSDGGAAVGDERSDGKISTSREGEIARLDSGVGENSLGLVCRRFFYEAGTF